MANTKYRKLIAGDFGDETAYHHPQVLECQCANKRLVPWIVANIIVVLILFGACAVQFRRTASSDCRKLVYSPANNVISYLPYTLDAGYGQNDSITGKRTIYAGKPTPEMDEAWDILEAAKHVRLTPEEAAQLPVETAELHIPGGGNLVLLNVFHQLHCLNVIRKALNPDYYYFPHPETFYSHIWHCINNLRQSIMCASDVAVLPFDRKEEGGKVTYSGRFHDIRTTCRDFNKVLEFAQSRSVLEELSRDS